MSGIHDHINDRRGDAATRAAISNLQKREQRLELHWSKGAGGAWCRLDQLDARTIDGSGVFIIWRDGGYVGDPSVVLYTGHGSLRHEIARCQSVPLFQNSSNPHITWARIRNARHIEPVAAYLYQKLRPIWGEVLSPENARAVNLPLKVRF